MVTTTNVFHTCDACNHEVSGYTKKDLLAEGWTWHDAGPGRMFVICGTCEHAYEQRRAAKAAA